MDFNSLVLTALLGAVPSGPAAPPDPAAPPAAPPAAAHAAAGVKLTVTLAGIRSDKGSIICEVFAGPDGYPKEPKKARQIQKVDIHGKAASCVFEGLAPGTYAVASYHDENGNGKLDTNWLGIPSEGVGASNDAKGSMGPPPFDKAKVSVGSADLGLTIHLTY